MTLYCRALIHPIIIGICARFSDNKDFVQSVKIFIRSSGDSNKYHILVQPIRRIFLLMGAEDVNSPKERALGCRNTEKNLIKYSFDWHYYSYCNRSYNEELVTCFKFRSFTLNVNTCNISSLE